MNDQSNGQKLFLTRLRRHRITVLISRVLILTVFLFLWELCARFEIIDSFIFSSPSKITLCFLEMLKNRSLFLHIGITLYETFISFILVILLSILAAILLWYSKKLSEILEPYLVVLNSLPKSAACPSSDRMARRNFKNNYYCRNVRRHLRKYLESDIPPLSMSIRKRSN